MNASTSPDPSTSPIPNVLKSVILTTQLFMGTLNAALDSTAVTNHKSAAETHYP